MSRLRNALPRRFSSEPALCSSKHLRLSQSANRQLAYKLQPVTGWPLAMATPPSWLNNSSAIELADEPKTTGEARIVSTSCVQSAARLCNYVILLLDLCQSIIAIRLETQILLEQAGAD